MKTHFGIPVSNAFSEFHMDQRGDKGCASEASCQLFLGLIRTLNAQGWQWLDGTQYDGGSYKNWALGEPNNFSGHDNCVVMTDDGTWNDIHCHGPRMWLCEKDAKASTTPPTSTATVPTLICEEGWSLFSESCYFLGIGVSPLLKSNCEGRNAHQVTIGDAAENAFVHREFFFAVCSFWRRSNLVLLEIIFILSLFSGPCFSKRF